MPTTTGGQGGAALKEDDKMPLFLIKLWNIVEDQSYQNIIRWDDSGYSFHIIDPYAFCKNVLPHYFKHNNLNSLIRQLNMYGFRKMTPLDRGGLTRSESDQDHLEFSHPYFVRDRPDLLGNIKRKSSARAPVQVNEQGDKMGQSINIVMDELRNLRDKQKGMSNRMEDLIKENESLWEELSIQRAQHQKQQQVVNKLVQFLVALVQPTTKNSSRLGSKRNLLAIDEPLSKRLRGNPSTSGIQSSSGLSDILDRLQRELMDGSFSNKFSFPTNGKEGPIIADVTEELAQSTNVDQPPFANVQTRAPHPQQGVYQQQPSRNPQYHPPMTSTQPSTSRLSAPYVEHAYTPQQGPINHPAAPPPNPNMVQPSQPIENTFSNELSEYLSGVDMGIDNCRDLIGGNWDYTFDEDAWNQLDPDRQIFSPTKSQTRQLALEDGPATSPENQNSNRTLLASPGPGHMDLFPHTPELLTPIQSPR
ncbi:unnamed protein product, partial [Mesorhabditis spiculigera]